MAFVKEELKELLEEDTKRNRGLAQNWFIVKEWNESKRYVASGLKGKNLYEAITAANGVLAWIKQQLIITNKRCAIDSANSLCYNEY